MNMKRITFQSLAAKKFFLQAMGASETKGVTWPPQWFALPEGSMPAVQHVVRSISNLPVQEFLSHTARQKDLIANPWPFEEYTSYCTAAVQCEPEVNQLVSKCVPRKCTEEEFWRRYFCNLYTRLRSLHASNLLTQEILLQEDDTTSNAIISIFSSQCDFQRFAQDEATGILRRDREDDEKLAVGINFAKSKGVIPQNVEVEPTHVIDVYGRSAEEVAELIVKNLGDAPQHGCIVVIHGLSGTGKGTTVSKLQETLPKATSWSNGNLFRALTLLAVTDCEQQGLPFSTDVLTPERLAEYMQMLSFDKFNEAYDIQIEGLGLKYLVSEIANTVLKEPKVGKNIPAVAQLTQGEVINFAAAATAKMSADGFNVLMEGRAQTLDYVRSPHRFELTLKDPIIIGMRRAAQRMVAKVVQKYKAGDAVQEATVEQMVDDLEAALSELVAPS